MFSCDSMWFPQCVGCVCSSVPRLGMASRRRRREYLGIALDLQRNRTTLLGILGQGPLFFESFEAALHCSYHDLIISPAWWSLHLRTCDMVEAYQTVWFFTSWCVTMTHTKLSQEWNHGMRISGAQSKRECWISWHAILSTDYTWPVPKFWFHDVPCLIGDGFESRTFWNVLATVKTVGPLQSRKLCRATWWFMPKSISSLNPKIPKSKNMSENVTTLFQKRWKWKYKSCFKLL